jgi:glutamate dehydrogenase/leucine dehydrogenase
MRGIWKWVGLAGVAGGVAGGVLVARDQRKRDSYTPEDIRARLHQRVAEAGEAN